MSTSSSTILIPSIEHHSLHHAPILTAGVPTPAILLDFEDACQDFFANAKGGVTKGGVTEDVQVTHVLRTLSSGAGYPQIVLTFSL